MATEEYANAATTTVSSGGTTAPSGGTVETWTVASSSPFPAASTGSVQFHVADPAVPSEMILVTNISGNTWTVTRGAESTTPSAHSAGFTIWLVVTAGDLTALATTSSVTAAVAVETSRAETAEGLAAAKANNLSDLAAAATARANLGLGPVTLTDAATIAVNAASGVFFRVTLGGNRTLGTPSNPTDGQKITFEIIQDGTGSRTLAYSGAYAFPASIPSPTLSSTAGQRDFLSFTYDTLVSLWQCTGWVPDQNAGIVAIAQGGTGQSTQQAAINALAGAQTSGNFLRGTGSNVQMSAILAGDLPAATTSAQGAVELDGTATDILPDGTQAAGANGKASDSGHVHPAFATVPSDNGLLAWSYSIDSAVSSDAMIAGTIYLAKIPIRYNLTATNIWFNVTVAASGSSSGSFAGLYSSGGSLLTGSSDLGALAVGFHSAAFTTPQALTGGTFVWAAMLVNYASTQPTVRAMLSAPGATINIVNLNLTAANFRSAVPAGGTLQTALLGSFTPSSNTATGALPFWFGIS